MMNYRTSPLLLALALAAFGAPCPIKANEAHTAESPESTIDPVTEALWQCVGGAQKSREEFVRLMKTAAKEGDPDILYYAWLFNLPRDDDKNRDAWLNEAASKGQ